MIVPFQAAQPLIMTFDLRTLFWLSAIALIATPSAVGDPPLVRSSSSGRWSDPSTWEQGRVPAKGDRVQVRPGHAVVFDGRSEAPIRSIHVAGRLEFDPSRDTLLTVGLILVQSGDDPGELDFDAHPAMSHADPSTARPAFLVGTASRPIAAGHVAVIRLAEVDGLDPETCPAIVCRGGRMEFHGAPVNPTWVKLGESAESGASSVVLDRGVEGWRVGDRVIVTSTRHQFTKDEALTPRVRQAPQTEERTIRSIDGRRLTLDAPLDHAHSAKGNLRGEVALLSRNVVVESLDPKGARGHTMYHRDSLGSISFAEFRHLGKPGKLGKYSLHFHKVGDSMRGASVVGASIWDSGNRWITIHGTNRLVVQDCVGYGSVGHGFFLEDGTEVDNILDGNLAVQATEGSPLPGQILAGDRNEGAGFWWANSRNSFTRNVAVECDGYGFRLDPPGPLDRPVGLEDVRLQPFLRFDANEAHSQRRYGVNLGGPAGRDTANRADPIGPDSKHPLSVKGLRIWDCHWAFTPSMPGLMVEDLQIAHSEYGFWKPVFDRHAYRGVSIYQCGKAYADIKGRLPSASAFPKPLEPVDDRSPVSVITQVLPLERDQIRVIGCSTDDGRIKAVRVNGVEPRPIVADFSRWEVTLGLIPGRPITLEATAEDASGNVERTPHVLTGSPDSTSPIPGIPPGH
jgi:hypothetical protein